MELGMIGLGRMGANMTERLVKGGHRVVGFDPKPEARERVEDKGAESAASLASLVASLKTPRTVWMMVPAGSITDGTVTALLPLLVAGEPFGFRTSDPQPGGLPVDVGDSDKAGFRGRAKPGEPGQVLGTGTEAGRSGPAGGGSFGQHDLQPGVTKGDLLISLIGRVRGSGHLR